MDRLGIERLSVFNMPPVDYVNLAADLGCQHISMFFDDLPYNPYNYAPNALRTDPAQRRALIAAMRDRGISISLGEGFRVMPGRDIRDRAADFDIMCELGVKLINVVTADPDMARSLEQMAFMIDHAKAAGVDSVTEFAPTLTLCDLPTALTAVRRINRPHFRLLVDTMHFMRTGGTPADLAALDPNLIGYVQLCDVPLVSTFDKYIDEAMYERMPLGEGELPMRELVAALPRNVVFSLEIPQRSRVAAGDSQKTRLQHCVDGARRLLKTLEA